MCRMKSAIIMKDRVFMPNYDSHTSMLEELGIDDTTKNARSKFVRAEMSPESGDMFESVSNWKFNVDQDILPNWFVAEYDEKRMREALKTWITTRDVYTNKKELGTLNVGDCFLIGNIEYIVLDKSDDGVACLSVDLVNSNKQFNSSSNNFLDSDLDKYLHGTYYDYLSKQVGEDNIVSLTIDLKSLDGLESYGECERKIGLLTLDQYRKYRKLIPNANGWWWLATPYSTPEGVGAGCVCYVGDGGGVGGYGCGYGGGVRPF